MEYAFHFTFQTTNNIAEYEALIAGLKIAKHLDVKKLEVFTDSQLVHGQVKEDFEVRESTLKLYKDEVTSMIKEFQEININLINRNLNENADALARLGASLSPLKKRKWIQLESVTTPSFKIYSISLDKPDWRTPIYKYLSGDKLNREKIKNQKVKNQSAHFTIINNELFRKKIQSKDQPYKICMSPEDGKEHTQRSKQGPSWKKEVISTNSTTRLLLAAHGMGCQRNSKKL